MSILSAKRCNCVKLFIAGLKQPFYQSTPLIVDVCRRNNLLLLPRPTSGKLWLIINSDTETL